jgi:hypothetical protein
LEAASLDRSLATNDRAFEPKAAEIIARCLDPAQHVRRCFASMHRRFRRWTASTGYLPLSPGRAKKRRFDTTGMALSLHAALNFKTVRSMVKTARRHTSADSLAF